MTWHTIPTDDPSTLRALGPQLDGDCVRVRLADGSLRLAWVVEFGGRSGWSLLDKHGTSLDDVVAVETDPRCKDCKVKRVARRDGGEPKSRCKSCADARSAAAAERHARALASGACTYPGGCSEPPVPGKKMCAPHARQMADYRLLRT